MNNAIFLYAITGTKANNFIAEFSPHLVQLYVYASAVHIGKTSNY